MQQPVKKKKESTLKLPYACNSESVSGNEKKKAGSHNQNETHISILLI